MAACTSRAAPSMSRLRSNCSVMLVEPSDEREVISVTPAMLPSARSSGVATVAAIVSGLAPGSDGADRDGREVHLRQRRDRQQPEGQHAGQRHADRDQRRGDRPGDERRRDVHARLARRRGVACAALAPRGQAMGLAARSRGRSPAS